MTEIGPKDAIDEMYRRLKEREARIRELEAENDALVKKVNHLTEKKS